MPNNVTMVPFPQLHWKNIRLYIFISIALLLTGFMLSQALKKPAVNGDWWLTLSKLSTAEFNGDLVTVHNVRNFRYDGSEEKLIPDWYDKTYNLNKITKVWYITEPFKNFSIAAHTFLSFEFSDGNYLSISIEARKTKGQEYNLLLGALRTYPLMYIAADERDAVFVRANIEKNDLYVYPVKLQDQSHARLLLVDMLEKMNNLAAQPEWYNTFSANCTSQIAWHINKLFPGRLPPVAWQAQLSGYADELALQQGLLDTNLSLSDAHKKYYITARSQQIGYVPNYSELIRQFPQN